MSMTLLCWNVAGRAQRQPEQAELIARLAPDLVLSAEISVPRVEYLHEWRQQAGLSDHSPLLAELDW